MTLEAGDRVGIEYEWEGDVVKFGNNIFDAPEAEADFPDPDREAGLRRI